MSIRVDPCTFVYVAKHVEGGSYSMHGT
jgi:hypothetical protein